MLYIRSFIRATARHAGLLRLLSTIDMCLQTTPTQVHVPFPDVERDLVPGLFITSATWLASFPGLHAQLLSLACSTKSGGRPGRTYHVMRAAANVMFSLLTSGFVLSPSLFFPEFSSFFLFSLSSESDCYWIDRGRLATVRDVTAARIT